MAKKTLSNHGLIIPIPRTFPVNPLQETLPWHDATKLRDLAQAPLDIVQARIDRIIILDQ